MIYYSWKGNDETVCGAKNGKTVYDEASKHGLIYVVSLNKGDSQGICPVHIEVSGIFVIGCHYAVGSGISITKLLMELTDSVFIEPSLLQQYDISQQGTWYN
ncbi:MAG: hypothetical protein EZS28_009641 [Streblomastix strix]|uniref:Uncharacterized protein n=1 Tax=Streblomastix strix TaxID=222440 RepID=A0A5J4WKK4_9EUKA|nr:MAG: hypothetical protein EZS28_009641 [Streblomastix strix]